MRFFISLSPAVESELYQRYYVVRILFLSHGGVSAFNSSFPCGGVGMADDEEETKALNKAKENYFSWHNEDIKF